MAGWKPAQGVSIAGIAVAWYAVFGLESEHSWQGIRVAPSGLLFRITTKSQGVALGCRV
jgi:hypothetical protein